MNRTVHRRPTAPGLVASLFGLAERVELPATVLVELLGDLGLTPSAARRLLARMREQGQLASHRRGRAATYAMVGPFAATAHRLQHEWSTVPEWPGHFHALLHRVPEAHRAYRDRLRRAATVLGYASWQPGVLLSSDDRSARLADVLADVPPGAHVLHATLGMTAAEAAVVASDAWELPALAEDLRAHVPLLTSVADADVPPASAATLRRLTDLTNRAFVDLIRDPGLPAVLRPPDWPGDELRRALGRLAASHGRPASAHVRARLAAAGDPAGPADPEGPAG